MTCKLITNLKEKYYNFSLKMSAKEREFFSEHSSNFRSNYQTMTNLGEKHFDEFKDKDEDYALYMDENKKVKVKYFNMYKKNQNFKKLRSELKEGEMETSETSKFENENSLIQDLPHTKEKNRFAKSVNLIDKKLSYSAHGHTWVQKKDIAWVYNDVGDRAPSLEVPESFFNALA